MEAGPDYATGQIEENKFPHGHSAHRATIRSFKGSCMPGVCTALRLTNDKRMITILILFDYCKAFDSIPHSKILAKLQALNMADRTSRWLSSYLADRLQAVVDEGGLITEWLRAASGVSQGSVLGPVLFVIHINDLPQLLKLSKHMIFADHTQIHSHCMPSKLLQGLAAVQEDAQTVASWARENGLTLNSAKCKVMMLVSQTYVSRIDLASLPRVMIDNVSLDFVTGACNFGVWITTSLDWKLQINPSVTEIRLRERCSFRPCCHA